MTPSSVRSLLCLVALGLALVGCAPIVKHLPTPTAGAKPASGAPTALPSLQTTPQPALLERRELVLEWPETLREKDSSLIRLTIAMNEQGQVTATVNAPAGPGGTPIDIPNIYDTHNIVAVGRLDLAGMDADRESHREPLRPGQAVSFLWSIHANDAGVYQGVVWLHLELVPKDGGQVDEILLLARQVEIKVVTILGMPGSLARTLGAAGLVVSTVLGYPWIQGRISEWLKRRKGKRPGAGRRPTPADTKAEEVEKPEEP